MPGLAAVFDWSGDGRRASSLEPARGHGRIWSFARLNAAVKARTVENIATLRFLTGTIAGMRSRLIRTGETPTVAMEPAHMSLRLRVLAADACCVCGSTVEDGLARLGSTLCHDCRRGTALRGPARP